MPAWPVINQLRFPERHFSANSISPRLGEVQMKICKGSLQALVSSAPRGFAARSRVLTRPVSLAQIGELARRLGFHKQKFPGFRTDPDCVILGDKTLHPRSNLTVRTMVHTC